MNSDPVKNTPAHSWFFRMMTWLFWLVGILIILILFVLPVLASWALKSGYAPKNLSSFLSLLATAQTWLARIVSTLWIFFLGSCFASFLNVVAWRVPRGGLITGSSHCPDCDQQLRFRDNTPIIGWLRNGGRCSNCGLSIPIRYLLVEIFLGTLFLLFASVQLLTGGWNLPFVPLEKLRGFEHLISDPNPGLISLTVYHLVLICLLFTFTLIKSETLKIPRKVWLVGLAFGFLLPVVWPSMNLVSWELGQVEPTVFDRGSWSQLLTLGLGLTVGIALGILLQYWRPVGEAEHPYVFQPTYIGEEIAALSLVGLFLGWQSALSVCLLCLPLVLLAFLTRLRWSLFGPTGCIFLATLIHLFCWRITTNCPYWPSGQSNWLGWIQ